MLATEPRQNVPPHMAAVLFDRRAFAALTSEILEPLFRCGLDRRLAIDGDMGAVSFFQSDLRGPLFGVALRRERLVSAPATAEINDQESRLQLSGRSLPLSLAYTHVRLRS